MTPRQTCPRPNGLGRNLRSKTRWFTGFCNSHQVSHFATFFIDARAEISIAESRYRLISKEGGVPPHAHRVRGGGGARSCRCIFLGAIRAGVRCCASGASPADGARPRDDEGGGARKPGLASRAPGVSSRVHGSFCRAGFDNDPSAGSPTETLLRLLLPLNDKVQWTSRDVAGSEPPASPRSEHFTGPFNR